MRRAAYFFGRGLQVLGMWLLAVDLFTAGPLGPSFELFAAGVVVFVAGWALTRVRKGEDNANLA
jgi:hypothetical protein